MSAYWQNPPRAHIIAWARGRWPDGKFSGWKLARLRALWHNVNKRRYA